MRALRRLGVGPDGIEPHHLAMEGSLLLGPQRLHGEDALAHQLEAGLVARTMVLHLVGVPAAADPEDEAAPDSRSRLATHLAVTMGSRCAMRQMPVPITSLRVAAAAKDSATKGSWVCL